MIKLIKLITKYTRSQPGKSTIAIHLLPNISRSKGKQRMKFGQLIDYNTRNFFFGKSCPSDKLFVDPFLKSQN